MEDVPGFLGVFTANAAVRAVARDRRRVFIHFGAFFATRLQVNGMLNCRAARAALEHDSYWLSGAQDGFWDDRLVDDVVAVEVALDNGERRYFLTWGRVQDAVDAAPLEALVMHHAGAYDLGGAPISASVCSSLRQARDAPYFYEGLVHFGRAGFADPGRYEQWRSDKAAAMEQGRELYYLGRQ